MAAILEVSGLKKTYKNFELKNVSFSIHEDCITGFIGVNGAGKTTTINALLNLVHRDGGIIKFRGKDISTDEKTFKDKIGVVFDSGCFYDELTIKDMTALLAPAYSEWDNHTYTQYLERFSLQQEQTIGTLSKGMKMKYALALALSHNAELLIMDEPTSGLDPVSRDELLKILSEYIEDGEHSVLFSTHITGDLERAADYITYISYGELYFTGSKDDFVDMFRIVKGGIEELSDDLKNKAAGIRTFPTGFEALMKTEDINGFSNLTIEPATIDEIVVFTSKKGDDYE